MITVTLHECPHCECEPVQYEPLYGPITEADHLSRERIRAIYGSMLEYTLKRQVLYTRFAEGSNQHGESVEFQRVDRLPESRS